MPVQPVSSLLPLFIQTQYRLTIAAGSGGTTDPKPGTYMYDPGKQATITALPDAGYSFDKWTGDASGKDNPLTITMNSDKSITANFIAKSPLPGPSQPKRQGLKIR